MEQTTKGKTIFYTLITLSIPTILEQLLSTLLQYVDTAMVGQLGEQATAAISVTTTITWLVNSMASALSTAAVAMVAKYLGAKEYNKLYTLRHLFLKATLFTGGILTFVSLLCAPFIPMWMNADEAIWKEASRYFAIISLPLIFRVASSILGAAIRGTQNTKTPMLINFLSNGLNVILNYLLIYTCNLGVTGAAIGSAISYTIGGILMCLAYLRNTHLKEQPYATPVPEATASPISSGTNKALLRELLHISFPVLATNIISCLGYVVFAGMVSGMGTTRFAAHSIAVTAETIFYIPGYGLRNATSALVGLSYGEGDTRKLKLVSRQSIILTLIMMIFSGVLLYLTAYPLMCLFTSSLTVAAIGSELLKIVAFTEPFFGLMVVLEGIFYGLGRTKYVFFAESASMWGIRILFTYLCVNVWELGLHHVWYCMIADNVCKALSLAFIYKIRHHKLAAKK